MNKQYAGLSKGKVGREALQSGLSSQRGERVTERQSVNVSTVMRQSNRSALGNRSPPKRSSEAVTPRVNPTRKNAAAIGLN